MLCGATQKDRVYIYNYLQSQRVLIGATSEIMTHEVLMESSVKLSLLCIIMCISQLGSYNWRRRWSERSLLSLALTKMRKSQLIKVNI